MIQSILALILGFASLAVNAETIPATAESNYPAVGTWTVGGVTGTYSSCEAAGQAALAKPISTCADTASVDFTCTFTSCTVSASSGTVYYHRDGHYISNGLPTGVGDYSFGAGVTWSCPSGGTVAGTSPSKYCSGGKKYTCPDGQGWTLSGSSCTRPDCPVGQDRDASGQCVKNCINKQGLAAPNGNYSTPADSNRGSVGGCQVECRTLNSLLVVGGVGGTLLQMMTNCKYTGASAGSGDPVLNPEPAPNPNDSKGVKDCIGRGMGYIQSSTGVVTCVAAEDAPPENRPTTTESTGTESGTDNSGGGTDGTQSDGKPDPDSPDYKDVQTSTTTNGSETTTTTKTTTNPDSGGNCPSGAVLTGGKCVKTEVTSQSTNDFCTDNPNAAACKDLKDQCIENPDRVACANFGSPEAVPDLLTKSQGGAISPVPLGGAGSCPADIVLPKGMSLSFEGICMYVEAMKPLILIFAWIAAGLIMIGAF